MDGKSHHKEDCVEECDGEKSVEVDVPSEVTLDKMFIVSVPLCKHTRVI